MEELVEAAEAAEPRSTLDLTGIAAGLHDYLLAVESGFPNGMDALLASARRVMENADGSVIVQFASPVMVGKALVPRIRLRPIRARDYIDGTTRALVEAHNGYGETLEFAVALSDNGAAIGELQIRDADAVSMAVRILRGNWFSPKS